MGPCRFSIRLRDAGQIRFYRASVLQGGAGGYPSVRHRPKLKFRDRSAVEGRDRRKGEDNLASILESIGQKLRRAVIHRQGTLLALVGVKDRRVMVCHACSVELNFRRRYERGERQAVKAGMQKCCQEFVAEPVNPRPCDCLTR